MYNDIPYVPNLTAQEIQFEYEKNPDLSIVRHFDKLDYDAMPVVLCKNHGSFAGGKDARQVAYNTIVLEEVAKMAAYTEMIQPNVERAPRVLLDKQYYRKHGSSAYYGQKPINERQEIHNE